MSECRASKRLLVQIGTPGVVPDSWIAEINNGEHCRFTGHGSTPEKAYADADAQYNAWLASALPPSAAAD